MEALLLFKQYSARLDASDFAEFFRQCDDDKVRDFFAAFQEANRRNSELRQMGLHPAHSHLRPVK
jgi:hypothetical protein